MTIYSITKENTHVFLKGMMGEYDVYGPVENHGRDVYLQRLTNESKLAWDYIRLPIGSKSVLYPQTDPLLSYDEKGPQTIPSMGKKAIFGLRSCDVRALQYTDKFFTRNFDDGYYSGKRSDMVLISLSCNAPDKNCFCTSTKTGPYLEDGFDLQFTDMGNGFFVEIGSPRGEQLLARFSGFFEKQPESAREAKQKIHDEAVRKFEVKVDMQKAVEILKTDKIKDGFWQKWADQCIYCGGCSYSCCTCTCFNVVDRGTEKEGIRYRCWDSCQFGGYTREASQHNPRPKDYQRMKRWFEHKLKYDVMTNGTYSCMGCGRCASVCPGSIGMINVVSEICAKGDIQ